MRTCVCFFCSAPFFALALLLLPPCLLYQSGLGCIGPAQKLRISGPGEMFLYSSCIWDAAYKPEPEVVTPQPCNLSTKPRFRTRLRRTPSDGLGCQSGSLLRTLALELVRDGGGAHDPAGGKPSANTLPHPAPPPPPPTAKPHTKQARKSARNRSLMPYAIKPFARKTTRKP